MKAYGLYGLSPDKTQWHFVLITRYYHSVLQRLNELTYAGKKCIIIEGEQSELRASLPAYDLPNNYNIIAEIDCAD